MTDPSRPSPALPLAEPRYPCLLFVARYGHALAILAGVVLAAVIAFAGGGLLLWNAIGVIAGAFAYLLLRCLGELVHLIADTMIPR